ncbi:hypothetical protein BGZ80_004400 [Entomortierella chlamydospora]|uniref:DDE Tnp4 domain-containing protein n=1 Tax=Entomortierella chlamydospora TaxID=101097 RepID=A0A9P6MN27_9FUNG|nr:hypothetical protein BGZ80_004400 [Entomortierella chlamydospora]
MVSERKKLLAILERRQKLEDEYNATHNQAIKTEMDSFNPDLMRYFRITTLQGLQSLYPKTSDMRAAAEKQRYFAPRKTPQQRTGEIYEDLRRAGTDVDYLEFVRVSKSVFLSIVSSVLSQHQVFKNHSNNGQETVEKQLAITLWRLGHHGKDAGIGEASKIFGLSEGTIMKCTQRCMEALRDISLDIISWPVKGEKQTIKSRIRDLANSGSYHSSLSSTSMSTSTSTSLGPDYERIANGTISDAVGILSTMHVFLVSRPLLSETEEYLVPLPPSALNAAASLSSQDYYSKKKAASKKQISEEQEPITSTSRSANKKARVSKQGAIVSNLTNEGAENMAEDGCVSVPHRTGKRGRPRKDAQLVKSTPSPSDDPTLAPSTPPTTEKKVTRARPASFVKSAYLKRDYGYNILLVCDSTTRIRFADVVRPAGWPSQQVFTSSQLSLESETLFEGKDYLVADSGLVPGPHVVPMFPESQLEEEESSILAAASTSTKSRSKTQVVDPRRAELEHKKRLNESLKAVQKRAKDCQRKLKARFPSLLGMRVQLKNDPASQENARNWILACMTVHNLVLGDDASYNQAWEDQLEEMEAQRAEFDPNGRYELDDDRDALDDEYDEDGQGGMRVLNDNEMYELEDTPPPEAIGSIYASLPAMMEAHFGNSGQSGPSSALGGDGTMDMRDGLNAGRTQSGHSLRMLLN